MIISEITINMKKALLILSIVTGLSQLVVGQQYEVRLTAKIFNYSNAAACNSRFHITVSTKSGAKKWEWMQSLTMIGHNDSESFTRTFSCTADDLITRVSIYSVREYFGGIIGNSCTDGGSGTDGGVIYETHYACGG